MHAKPEKVRTRRLKRQLKAALSIGVALCAGVFLACQKTVIAPEAGASDQDTGNNNNPNSNLSSEDAARAGESGDASFNADANANASDALAIVDANKSDALVKVTKNPRDAAVDRREHRKGMPVPDNLLE